MALRVLLADAKSDRTRALAERLKAGGGMEVLRAPEGADLADAAAVLTPDAVIVDVGAAIALFRRYRRVEEELARAKATIEERRTLDRAKAMLMRRRGIGEPEAYRWLRRKAMNENRRMVDVAAALLREEAADRTPR